MNQPTDKTHPHQGSPLLRQGSELASARSALILLHGRGASAQDIIGLAQAFSLPDDMIVLAPQAAGSVWYPQRLIAPIESNEPYLSSALRRLGEVVEMLEQAGIPAERILIGGFSQGASLAIEFVLRSGRRWGGLLAFSGGYIWPLGQPRAQAGSLAGTPVFLGCSDIDPHIPLARVEETAALLQAVGAQVDLHLYPNMGHTIIQEEIDAAQHIITAIQE
jgi:glyoxalase family protein